MTYKEQVKAIYPNAKCYCFGGYTYIASIGDEPEELTWLTPTKFFPSGIIGHSELWGIAWKTTQLRVLEQFSQ